MCGIAGIVLLNQQKINLLDFTHGISLLKHRGPDNTGFYIDDDCSFLFSHVRLSILDLSINSNQPFISSDSNIVLVYNGEVYNYRNLARKYNLKLQTTSDTEVVAELLSQKGVNVVNEFNGMFAFACFNRLEKRFYFVRDRFGVKPLYYYKDKDYFVFASEIKYLLQFNFIKQNLSISKQSISNFLHFGFTLQPNTIFNEIKKLTNSTVLSLDFDGKITLFKYWQIPKNLPVIKNEKKLCDELDDLLNDSVRLRLVSDVPVGTFLSGGTDSGLITALAQRNFDKPIKTFTVGMKDSKMDESDYAENIAKYLKTEHYSFKFTEQNAQELIFEVIDHFDEPFSDLSALPTYFISKIASKYVKVLLTGDGGDELFWGYGSHIWARRLNKFNSVLHLIKTLLNFVDDPKLNYYSSLFDKVEKNMVQSKIFSHQQGCFSIFEIKKLLKTDVYTPPTIPDYSYLNYTSNQSDLQALFEFNYYLSDDLLTKVDMATMKTSIEAREPYLDYRIVEFARQIPENYKLNRNNGKYILKKILYRYIPQQYYQRPKWGFAIPFNLWLKRDFRFLIDNYLSDKMVERVGLFNNEEVKKLKISYYNGNDFVFNKIWLLLLLNRWMDSFGYNQSKIKNTC
jgi:asparagine synthase (glutamine-hydrolysing)